MKDINLLVRENIKKLLPYSSARDDFQGQGLINLDANENPYFNSYNRYPDPYQRNLKLVISELKCVNIENIFIGHGSDEIIDLIIRAFCEPNRDAILTLAPSYGMYKVCADINNVECLYYTLNENYQIDFDVFDKLISPQVKVVFICSPNNPSGNSFDNDHIISLIKKHNAIFVIDEAYIDFSNKESLKNEITVMNNLIVMQTLSKAYGMAALRIGLAFCNHLIVATLNKIKPPYNLSTTAQHSAIHFLQSNNQIVEIIETIKIERNRLFDNLKNYKVIERVFPSDANFLLIKCMDADDLYYYLCANGIIIRNRNKIPGCENCLRITVGTSEENDLLMDAIKKYNYAKTIINR